jgi:murein DD-endopeptidase MepM/ murein hydrolase activator NlpD
VERLQVLVALKRRNRFLNLSFPLFPVYVVVLCAACVLVAGMLLGGQVFGGLGESSRVSRLRQENANLKQRVEFYAAAMDTFREFLVAAESMDNKLRAAVNLQLIPGDIRLMGVGGRAEPALDARVDNLLRRARFERQSLVEIESEITVQQERLRFMPSIWPVRGWVTSGYGRRRDPFTGARVMHPGLDIVAPSGTQIVAAADGRVCYSGWKPGWGRVIEIDHGYGLRSFYGHCRSLLVRSGAAVQRGQAIATVGSSGRSTGTHLHYGVKSAGAWTDPANYIITYVAAD